ncbi:dynein heavy chain and region D6 of dynein motor, partial [Helicosporidium sp. ATCC 50920]
SKAAGLGFVPELMACTTVVDFTVTSAGIEEQLLDMVVGQERPDLKESSEALAAALSEGTLQLQQLEDGLLAKLESCAGAMLDAGLVASLERTKSTAEEIAARMAAARETEVSLRAACEVYRPVAVRCTLLYMLQESLRHLDRVYRFSLSRFVAVMRRSLRQTPGGADESDVPPHLRCHAQVDTQHRVSLLAQHASLALFRHLAQSMSEEHKLVAAAHLCMSVLREKKELSGAKAAYLMPGRLGRADRDEGGDEARSEGLGAAGGVGVVAGSRPAPASDWITPEHWAAVLTLQHLPGFASLPDDVAGNLKRWKEWAEAEAPEELPPPGDWKRASDVDRLLLVRALRADRLAAALAAFVARALGAEYVSSLPFDLERSMLDCSAAVPVLVLLSPGLDVVAAVEAAGRRAGVSLENGRLTSVSMGQGQEAVAWTRLQAALASGGWVLLQNIHLMLDWTASTLAKFVDGLGESAHPEFR